MRRRILSLLRENWKSKRWNFQSSMIKWFIRTIGWKTKWNSQDRKRIKGMRILRWKSRHFMKESKGIGW